MRTQAGLWGTPIEGDACPWEGCCPRARPAAAARAHCTWPPRALPQLHCLNQSLLEDNQAGHQCPLNNQKSIIFTRYVLLKLVLMFSKQPFSSLYPFFSFFLAFPSTLFPSFCRLLSTLLFYTGLIDSKGCCPFRNCYAMMKTNECNTFGNFPFCNQKTTNTTFLRVYICNTMRLTFLLHKMLFPRINRIPNANAV